MNPFDNKPRDYYTNNHKYNNDYRYKYDSDEAVSIIAWIGILILTGIPFVNIIALLIMAFGIENKNIRNYARASLILLVSGLIIAILLGSCS